MKNLFTTIKGLFTSNKTSEVEMLKQQIAELTKLVNPVIAETVVTKVEETVVTKVEETVVTKVEETVVIPVVYDYKELERTSPETLTRMIEDIQDNIGGLGYKAIPEILSEYDDYMIAKFVRLQSIQLGQFDPESDNIEELSRAQLIQSAVDNNQLQFKMRKIEQGQADVTAKQKDFFVKRNLEVPSDTFEASEMIEKILKSEGVDTSKPFNKEVSPAQLNAIAKMSSKLGIAEVVPTDKFHASEILGKLKVACDTKFGAEPASDKQKEYYKNLIKNTNKKMTKKRVDFLLACTKEEISKEIEVLSKEAKLDNTISKGQIDYIVSLSKRLSVPYSVEEVSRLDKKSATVCIEKLQRRLLGVYGLQGHHAYSKEEVMALSKDEVKNMLSLIASENKAKYGHKEDHEDKMQDEVLSVVASSKIPF